MMFFAENGDAYDSTREEQERIGRLYDLFRAVGSIPGREGAWVDAIVAMGGPDLPRRGGDARAVGR
jgi:hypothetical protein